MKPEVWYWEKMCSPHKAGLLVSLAEMGCTVRYVVEELLSNDRAQQGWHAPGLEGVTLTKLESESDVDELVKSSSPAVIHICDGIRANGMVSVARAALRRYDRRFWVFMESVDDAGWRGILKRLEYRRLFWWWRDSVSGVLAAGDRTTSWVQERGVVPEFVFPFAYFMRPGRSTVLAREGGRKRYRFIFVGQFIPRKRMDLLVEALAECAASHELELMVVGSGPLDEEWRALAEARLPGRVSWIGRLHIDDVPPTIANADCLVLPSQHDGWGGVISEALMQGVPVVCSDRCGAAVVVRASGYGGIFAGGDRRSLVEQLRSMLAQGPLSDIERQRISHWARCLGNDDGAEYLLKILEFKGVGERPSAPWIDISSMES